MENIENYISNQKLLDRLNDYCLELIAQKEFEMVDFIKATNEQSSKPKKQI